jgi:E1A/CREB-binding protein
MMIYFDLQGGSKIQNLNEKVSNIMKTSGQQDHRIRSNRPRKDEINRCLTSLIHTLYCRDNACITHGCQKMKKVVEHTKVCPKKSANYKGCNICIQLMNLCLFHAKYCRQSVCYVPFCRIMKKKLTAINGNQAQKESIQL